MVPLTHSLRLEPPLRRPRSGRGAPGRADMLSCRSSRARLGGASAFAVVACVLCLTGCESVALTLLGIGASAGVQHSLKGVTYRTFAAPADQVKSAALVALEHMAIKVNRSSKQGSGEVIVATAADRNIEVELEAISPKTTRMRTVARQGVFYDSATAVEIIAQTEKVLGS